MHLRSIHLENYRAIECLDLRLDDALGRLRPVTVLAGPNGCGKTTVLFAVVQALRGAMGYRTEDVPEPTTADLRRAANDSVPSARPREIVATLELQLSDDEVEAVRGVFNDTLDLPGVPSVDRLPVLDDGRIVLTWAYPPEVDRQGKRRPTWWVRSTEPREALFWLKGRQFAIRGKNRKVLSDPRLVDRVGGLLLFPQDRNLRSRVLRAENAQSVVTGPLGPQMDDDDEASTRPRPTPDVWGILQYLSTYARTRDTPLDDEYNWEKRIQENFNRICHPKSYVGFRYVGDDPFGAPYLREGEQEYPLDLAASGEQVILEYLTRLMYPTPLHRSLILIDEPEVHLHPAWVRRLYLALRDLGHDNQFLVTTHSPELRALAAEDGALIDLGDLGVSER